MFSAGLSAALGRPFACASHFAPDYLGEALDFWRSELQPSAELGKLYAAVAIPVFAAEPDAAARRLFTSWQPSFVNLRCGTPGLATRMGDDADLAVEDRDEATLQLWAKNQ